MNKDQIMLQAAYLAKQGKGKTAPNPCVGAVIVKDGQIVARGWHKAYGQAHAEVEAITEARNKGVDLKNTSLFVTLEPCNHYGKTPPCTRAILEAGIKKVFVGARDPNPHVQGGGIEFLRANGVRVEAGILEEECRDLIADFIAWTQEKRPYSYLKIASTLDGKIATYNGHSKWITSHKAREEVHRLRSQVGAVIVGGNTFYADNPKLTCRLEGDELAQPLAVIVTSRLPETDDSFYLLSERAAQTVFWTTEEKASSSQAERLRSLGCQVWGLPLEAEKQGSWEAGKLERGEDTEKQNVESQRRGFDLRSGFDRLFQEYKIYYTLCEGGGRLALSLLEQDLVDELCLFLAPKILGDNAATSSFSGRKVESMDEAINFRLTDLSRIGPDIFLRLMKNRDN
ncbi:bifunctional diaminohydroxyphosphoribosylaminopyrimidine deaminase/5-amino-6-(5-phosphoribosylamino)uracil reductase RibD [Desulfohalobiaceae bacterium Ax17]|uniref:bifunctional diaminohydroxyphosphoribosylaminopyrimidine deaminase/5-amino-6-(5-phosphoribosylamino)uracil reductase RibD n=1 Tax=Desulfovulcanus ferrireducens TaxID=2831190 RepID=UPI00207BB86D|nr:bifunctional diaminohydroxyphosphoribosylaminopyrimidine deaminase/5-amino-6-(5-phosphoribosylamino)uracil reductase RibD [Desulfovulcanus ferrireducens]MBT8762692.1 bifunctional diaminohydroxyphosphoribosylaminopyrimidine deaminase/5-amino-6-(5-phosphoribosylamino)uracil reductase RibD [Desulfovulcanus ferrireducens]